jgi:hypothetical protein
MAAVGILMAGGAAFAPMAGHAAPRWEGTKPIVMYTNPEGLDRAPGMILKAVPAAADPLATKPVVAIMNRPAEPAVARVLPTRGCVACGNPAEGTKAVVAWTNPRAECRMAEAKEACARAAFPCPECVAAK